LFGLALQQGNIMRALVRTATTLVSALTVGGCSAASHSTPKPRANEPAEAGRPRSQKVRVTETRAASRLGIATASRPAALPSDADLQHFTDQIDGRPVTVWRNRINRTYHVGAQWDSPRLWLVGESTDLPSAETQLVILRTVRFVPK
jgi:hypothetical protein